MGNSRENILAALELALAEILNVETLNVWVSVKDRSINKILTEAGVNKNYSPIVLEELNKLGLVEGEGSRSGMRYKIISNVIPDVSRLALTIYNRFSKKTKQYYDSTKLSSEGYPESKKSDLHPLKTKKMKAEKYDPKTVKIKRQVIIPNLGDIRFIIKNDKIYEGKIISLYYPTNSDNTIAYDIRIANELWLEWLSEYATNDDIIPDEEPDKYEVVKKLGVKDLFETPEVAADYLIRKVVRYTK